MAGKSNKGKESQITTDVLFGESFGFCWRDNPSRRGVFSHRLAEATAGMRSSNHFIRIAKSFKEAWTCGNYL